jgi:hypothetical protein
MVGRWWVLIGVIVFEIVKFGELSSAVIDPLYVVCRKLFIGGTLKYLNSLPFKKVDVFML